MKILNIFPIDWNSPDCLPERTWTIPNERGDNFNWITGMFHETITSKINLDLNYNQLADINQIKKLSDKNIPYNIFVKFYQFRHLVGVDVDNETIKDELSFFYHYLKDDKSKFITNDIKLGRKISFSGFDSIKKLRLYDHNNQFIGIGESSLLSEVLPKRLFV